MIFTVIERARRRDDVVEAYAKELAADFYKRHEWGRINAAIVDKWSEAGLRYIKRRAWKLFEEGP